MRTPQHKCSELTNNSCSLLGPQAQWVHLGVLVLHSGLELTLQMLDFYNIVPSSLLKLEGFLSACCKKLRVLM